MNVVHTYFYIVVDTQWGCHTLKKIKITILYLTTLDNSTFCLTTVKVRYMKILFLHSRQFIHNDFMVENVIMTLFWNMMAQCVR